MLPEERWRSAYELEPERAFIGAVLQLHGADAARVLKGVQESDFIHPALASIFTVAVALTVMDVDPSAQAIYLYATTQSPVIGAHKLAAFAQLLYSLFRDAPTPAMASFFRRGVLDRAVRRRIRDSGVRLQQVASECSSDRLLEAFEEATTQVRETAKRAGFNASVEGERAGSDGIDPDTLPAGGVT